MDTQARIEAAKARLEANRAAAVEAGRAGPPCGECRYPRATRIKGVTRCSHPVLIKQTFNVASGDLKHHVLATIHEARAEDGLCGPEAILFEPKSLLARLLGR